MPVEPTSAKMNPCMDLSVGWVRGRGVVALMLFQPSKSSPGEKQSLFKCLQYTLYDLLVKSGCHVWSFRPRFYRANHPPRTNLPSEPRHEKTNIYICENKDADQLRGEREADTRFCFRHTDSTIPLLPKSEISSL